MIPGITEADVCRFTEGDCHILAYALNKRTSYPIATFYYEEDYKHCGDIHAFILLPGGRVLDVTGIHAQKDFYREWITRHDYGEDYKITPQSWRELRRAWGGASVSSYSYRRAAIVANTLLDRYRTELSL